MVAAFGSSLGAAMGACGTDERPPRGTGTNLSSGSGTGGGGGVAVGACSDSERRSCKVQIDETNCFVGEQECIEGEWGPCVDAGDLDSLAMGGASGCPSNPCNPWCQEFGNETPASPITATGTPPPAGGTVAGLPAAWKMGCMKDQQYGSVNCTTTGACQFDHHCDNTPPVSGTGQYCVPFLVGEFDPGAGDPNFTIPVICAPDAFEVCNRGADHPGGDVEISFYSATPGNCGTNTGATGLSGECIFNEPIPSGQCITITHCGAQFSGTTTVYINASDSPPAPPASIPETDKNDSWSLYHPSTSCACTNVSSSGSLSQVNILLLLDNSGSMGHTADGCLASCGCTEAWDSAVAAISSFVQLPSADPLRLAFTVYDEPNGDCDTSYSGGTCDPVACRSLVFGPDFLSNNTHSDNIAPGTPGEMTGATLACREHWAAQSATDPSAHCPKAGPAGGAVCGSSCDNFCTLSQAVCSGGDAVYADIFSCIETDCLGWPDANEPYSADPTDVTDSFRCRLYQLSLAATDATLCDAHGGPNALDGTSTICVEPLEPGTGGGAPAGTGGSGGTSSTSNGGGGAGGVGGGGTTPTSTSSAGASRGRTDDSGCSLGAVTGGGTSAPWFVLLSLLATRRRFGRERLTRRRACPRRFFSGR